jgi:hypothetical protein
MNSKKNSTTFLHMQQKKKLGKKSKSDTNDSSALIFVGNRRER